MTGKQTFVGAAGLALIAANFWGSEAHATISGGIFNPGGNTAAAHGSLAVLGGELLFVIVGTVLAGMSDMWGSLMAATVVALFVLFAINHYGSGAKTTSSSSPLSGPTGIVKGAAA
jgi:hypothetical protein